MTGLCGLNLDPLDLSHGYWPNAALNISRYGDDEESIPLRDVAVEPLDAC